MYCEKRYTNKFELNFLRTSMGLTAVFV